MVLRLDSNNPPLDIDPETQQRLNAAYGQETNVPQLVESTQYDMRDWARHRLIQDETSVTRALVDVLTSEGDLDTQSLPCLGLSSPLPWHQYEWGDVPPEVGEQQQRFFRRIATLEDWRRLRYKGWIQGNFDPYYSYGVLQNERQTDAWSRLNVHDDRLFHIRPEYRDRIQGLARMNLIGAGSASQWFPLLGSPETLLNQVDAECGLPKQGEITLYFAQGQGVELRNTSKAFPPSYTSMLFAHNIDIKPEETVYGVGAGSAFLEILAKKLGAKSVRASEADGAAVEVANNNVQQNNVTDCVIQHGSMFDCTDGQTFDVVVANLPQTPIDKVEINALGTVDAGEDGARFIEEFLQKMPGYIHSNSRVYVCIASIAHPEKVYRLAHEHFNVRLIAQQRIKLPSYILPRLLHLTRVGTTTDLTYEGFKIEEKGFYLFGDPNNPEVYTMDYLLELTPKS